MTTEAKEQAKEQVKTEGAGTEATKTPPAKEVAPPAQAKETAREATKTVAAPPAAEGAGDGRKRVFLKEDSDDIPEDVELIELSPRGMKSRITRATNKALRDRFGTDDIDDIQKQLGDLQKLKDEREADRRAKLDEKARLEEDVKKANERATAAERRAQAIYDQRLFDREENRVSKIAEKFLDPDYIDEQMPKLAKYLNENFSRRELDKMKPAKQDEVVGKFFEELVKKKPKFGKDFEAQRTEAETQAREAERPRVGVTNGVKDNARPGQRPAAGDNVAGGQKTYAPNRANSMNKQELQEALRRDGLRY